MNPFRDENPDAPASELVEKFLGDPRLKKAGPAHIHFATEVLRNYEAYLSQREYLQEVEEAHALVIQGYIVGMAVRDSSIDCIKQHIEVLSAFYDFLISQGHMDENPVAGARLPDRED